MAAKAIGLVTINPSTGAATGSGLTKKVYDNLLPFFGTIEAGAPGVPAKERLADLARGVAPGIFDAILFEPTATKTSAYTAAICEVVICDPTGGGFTVTLPDLSAADVGGWVIVKNDSASTNVITIDGDASDTIDGSLNTTISTGRGCVILIAKNTGEWIRGLW